MLHLEYESRIMRYYKAHVTTRMILVDDSLQVNNTRSGSTTSFIPTRPTRPTSF